MDKQKLWIAFLVSGLVLIPIYLASSLFGNGTVCSFQIRYALSDSTAHTEVDKPRPGYAFVEQQLRGRFVPNVCSSEQFESIFPKEAGKWGY